MGKEREGKKPIRQFKINSNYLGKRLDKRRSEAYI